jgi:hypothetical protein
LRSRASLTNEDWLLSILKIIIDAWSDIILKCPQKAKQILSGGWYQWEGGGHKERVEEDEYGENTMYSCM